MKRQLSRLHAAFDQNKIISAAIVFFICFTVFNLNARQIGAADTKPARYAPLLLWRNGSIFFNQSVEIVAQGHDLTPESDRSIEPSRQVIYNDPWAYWLVNANNDNIASLYPIVTPLLISPLYYPAVKYLDRVGWNQPLIDFVATNMEKLVASLIAALSAVIVFLSLPKVGNKWRFALAIFYGIGTNTWMISSQALWQHGVGELLIALLLYVALRKPSASRSAFVGVLCVFILANRPPDAILAGMIFLYVLFADRSNRHWMFLSGLPFLALLMFYNLGEFGNLAGGYGTVKPSAEFFQPLWSGILGLLVSPSRGLLLFTPAFIFIGWGIKQRRTTRKPDGSRSPY